MLLRRYHDDEDAPQAKKPAGRSSSKPKPKPKPAPASEAADEQAAPEQAEQAEQPKEE
ncbi:hypothetical protein [Streptomyces chryseus]